MENCPVCRRPLVPFRAKLVCRTPDCGFMENCCDGGRMPRGQALRNSDLAKAGPESRTEIAANSEFRIA